MLTLILSLTSEDTDLAKYTGLLKGGGDFVVVFDESVEAGELSCDGDVSLRCVKSDENIAEVYNAIVESSDKASDIFLLSDCIDLHGNILDEMVSCLYAGERHAIVYGQEIANSSELFETAIGILPKYSMTIIANPYCSLIKRKFINTLGFFDTEYSSLKYALMDYYYRLNKYGYSSVISHHALFSFNGKEHKGTGLLCSDMELFTVRYPFWMEKEKRHFLYGIDPCVEFLELFDTKRYPKKRILFDCVIMPPQHCGTSEFQISVFEAFYRLYKDKYDIFLYTNHEADDYHKLSEKYDNVIYPETLEGKYHLGFAPNQLMHFDAQATMNKSCLKVVQTMFDIMMVRIDEHFSVDVNTEVELGLRLSDGIVFISNYTKNDFLACFADKYSVKDIQFKVIYLATDIDAKPQAKYDLPFKDYFLIYGNAFKHKAIKETVNAVSNSEHNFIVVGDEGNCYIYPNVFSYKSGHLEEDFLGYLYANCKAVIFPSMYEGFGLPVVMSLKNNKRVIVYNNELNDELMEHFSEFKDYFLPFDRFDQIIMHINSIDFSKEPVKIEYNDSWDRVAAEHESFFDEILAIEINPDRLKDRWHLFKLIEASLINNESYTVNSLKQDVIRLTEQVNTYKWLISPMLKLKNFIKKRFPSIFRLLKRTAGRE
jgi:hypothetical protein